MRYFKVDSTAQAETLSRLLYSLMYPQNENVSTIYLFGWRTVAGVVLIEIDETQLCPVFQKPTTDTILAGMLTAFGNKIPSKDRTKYRNYMKNNSQVLLIKLIPSTLTEYTQQWVNDNTIIDL